MIQRAARAASEVVRAREMSGNAIEVLGPVSKHSGTGASGLLRERRGRYGNRADNEKEANLN